MYIIMKHFIFMIWSFKFFGISWSRTLYYRPTKYKFALIFPNPCFSGHRIFQIIMPRLILGCRELKLSYIYRILYVFINFTFHTFYYRLGKNTLNDMCHKFKRSACTGFAYGCKLEAQNTRDARKFANLWGSFSRHSIRWRRRKSSFTSSSSVETYNEM